MTFENDTLQIINDFGLMSASLIAKNASAGCWDSSGALLWTNATATSFACQIQVMPANRMRQYQRLESGLEYYEYVVIYTDDSFSIANESLGYLIQDKNNDKKSYKIIGYTSRWTGHQEIDAVYVAGSIQR